MADDAPVPPIAPLGAEPVAAPSRAAAVPAPPRAGGTQPMPPPTDELLGDATARAQLLAPRAALAAAEVTADVHDAAVHGDAIAGAIEESRARGRSERAEALAGGAASAGSGQAARIRVDPVPVDGEHDEVDPLAAIQPVEGEAHGSHARHERQEREAERHEDDLARGADDDG